jgi:hypothetical protein
MAGGKSKFNMGREMQSEGHCVFSAMRSGCKFSRHGLLSSTLKTPIRNQLLALQNCPLSRQILVMGIDTRVQQATQDYQHPPLL